MTGRQQICIPSRALRSLQPLQRSGPSSSTHVPSFTYSFQKNSGTTEVRGLDLDMPPDSQVRILPKSANPSGDDKGVTELLQQNAWWFRSKKKYHAMKPLHNPVLQQAFQHPFNSLRDPDETHKKTINFLYFFLLQLSTPTPDIFP